MAGCMLALSAVLHFGALLAPQPYRPASLNPARAFARRVGGAPRADAAGNESVVDVAVIGGGPAGHIMAALLGRDGHRVALVDPYPNRPWPNNYGAWRAEWESLSESLRLPELMSRCIRKEWSVTDCYFGGSHGMPTEQQTRLLVPYVQVDRVALKSTLNELIDASDVRRYEASLDARLSAPNLFESETLLHDAQGSSLNLSDGTRLRTKLVVDATGFESRITLRESASASGLWKELSPGYQIAYGFRCDCVGGHEPYAVEAMTLFDYRTDHLAADPAWEADAVARPSFVYAMPQGPQHDGSSRVFFEETSLVGRGARRLSFAELKRRCLRRLEHLGIQVVEGSLAEEEYCYIPMGGALPDPTQRIIPVGGAANTVHPATGYQLCRLLASSSILVAAVTEQLRRGDAFTPDAAAAAAHAALWPRRLRLQRDFQVFGGEFLLRQPVDNLRGFFAAFFQLEQPLWSGFLAGWTTLPGNERHEEWDRRLGFGLSIFVRFPPQVAASLAYYAVLFSAEYGPALLKSIFTPVFDFRREPELLPSQRRVRASTVYVVGDLEAKREALEMLRSTKAKESAPSPQVALLGEAVQ